MAKQEKSGFELLRSARLPEKLQNTLEDSLLFSLQLGAWRFLFAKRENALDLSFKTAGILQVPGFQNSSSLLCGVQQQILCCLYRHRWAILRRNEGDLRFFLPQVIKESFRRQARMSR